MSGNFPMTGIHPILAVIIKRDLGFAGSGIMLNAESFKLARSVKFLFSPVNGCLNGVRLACFFGLLSCEFHYEWTNFK